MYQNQMVSFHEIISTSHYLKTKTSKDRTAAKSGTYNPRTDWNIKKTSSFHSYESP